MKRIIYIFFLLMIAARVLGTPGQSSVFSWVIPPKQRLEIMRTAQVTDIINQQIIKKYDERNIIDLTCYEKKAEMSMVKGVFTVYQKKQEDSVFRLHEKYKADFGIKPTGEYKVPRKSIMPNLRNIPVFPERKLAQGDTWSEKGELVLNSFSIPFKLIFDTHYKLTSIQEKDGETLALIHYQYQVDKDLRRQGLPGDFPLRIQGANTGLIYWNVTKKQPVRMEDKYRMVFLLRTGQRTVGSHDFRMNIITTFKLYGEVTEDEKEKAKKELKKVLPTDIDVDTEKRGLVLRMGDILFNFDSYSLRNDARKNLDKIISAVKKKFPDREIIVEGHTDSIGKRGYNYSLSRNRARTVARYLKKGLGHDKFSYKGYGETKPRATNRTAKGRKLNRRVEIIIKLH